MLTKGEAPPLRDDLCQVTVLDAPEESELGATNAERSVSFDYGFCSVDCNLNIDGTVVIVVISGSD